MTNIQQVLALVATGRTHIPSKLFAILSVAGNANQYMNGELLVISRVSSHALKKIILIQLLISSTYPIVESLLSGML